MSILYDTKTDDEEQKKIEFTNYVKEKLFRCRDATGESKYDERIILITEMFDYMSDDENIWFLEKQHSFRSVVMNKVTEFRGENHEKLVSELDLYLKYIQSMDKLEQTIEIINRTEN